MIQKLAQEWTEKVPKPKHDIEFLPHTETSKMSLHHAKKTSFD